MLIKAKLRVASMRPYDKVKSASLSKQEYYQKLSKGGKQE